MILLHVGRGKLDTFQLVEQRNMHLSSDPWLSSRLLILAYNEEVKNTMLCCWFFKACIKFVKMGVIDKRQQIYFVPVVRNSSISENNYCIGDHGGYLHWVSVDNIWEVKLFLLKVLLSAQIKNPICFILN